MVKAPNTPNSENESVEIPKNKKNDLNNKFIKEFSENYYSGKDKNDRLDSLFSDDEISPEMKKEMEDFYDNNDEYDGEIDLTEIRIKKFQNKNFNDFYKTEKDRSNLKEIILGEYDFPENKIDELEKSIKKLNDKEIRQNLNNSIERHKFLEKDFKNLVKKHDMIKYFFTKFNLTKDYSQLSKEHRETIMLFFNRDGSLGKIDEYAVHHLFELPNITIEQKKEIIKFCFPTISLEKIRELKVLGSDTESFILAKKEEIIKKIKLEAPHIDDAYILSTIKDKEVEILTKDFFAKIKDEDIAKITDKLDLSEFSKKYNDSLEDINEKNNKELFPKGFESLVEKVGTLGEKINGISNFKKDCYIVLDLQKIGEKNTTKTFVKIKDFDDEKNQISTIDLGTPGINFSLDTPSDIYYNTFFDIFSKGIKTNKDIFSVTGCNFMTRDEIDKEIKDGKIEIANEKQKTKTELKVESDKQKKQEEIDNKNLELKDIASKHEDVIKKDEEIKIINIEINDSSLNENEKKDLENEKIELEIEREKLINLTKNNVSEGNFDGIALSDEEKISVSNINTEISKLVQEIDKIEIGEKDVQNILNEIDSEGKSYKFEAGLSFVIEGANEKGKKEKCVFTVDKIASGQIKVSSPWGDEEVHFQDFIDTFRSSKGKRLASQISGENIVDGINQDNLLDSDFLSIWGAYKFNDDGIYKKETENNIEYDYLESSESDELIHIDSISGENAIVSFGEYEIEKDGDKNKKKKITMFSNESGKKVSLSWLKAWIKTEKAKPSSLDSEKDVKEHGEGEKRKGSFSSWFFSNISISEVLAGLKLGGDTLEAYLKEGSEEHAAKVAQGVFGGVLKKLSPELSAELMSKVEESQKKRAQTYFDKLSVLDSGPATDLIEKWLLDSNTPQYKLEAGLNFMFSKYGVLYGKSGLKKHKGSKLWYKALGGDMSLIREEEAKAESEGQVFCEEALVISLLMKQCKNGHNGIKRRSKLAKEMIIAKSKGKKEDAEGGKAEAVTQNTVDKRIGSTIGELEAGNYPNAMGRLPEILNKGGSMAQMNTIPFIIAFSGEALTYEQESLQELHNYPFSGQLLPILAFFNKKTDIELLNETILEISKRYSKITGNKKILEDAETIFNNQGNNSLTTEKKVKATAEFYKNHGKVITGALHNLNAGETGENSELSKMILIEKDYWKDKDGNEHKGNAIFTRYYNKLSGFSEGFSWENEDLLSDGFRGVGTSGVNMKVAVKTLLRQATGGAYAKSKAGQPMWEEIMKEINAVKERDFGVYGEDSKKTVLNEMLRGFISGILDANGGQIDLIRAFLCGNTSAVASQFKSWGIRMESILEFSSKDVDEGKAKNLIDGFSDAILDGRQVENGTGFFSNLVGQVVDDTRSNVNVNTSNHK